MLATAKYKIFQIGVGKKKMFRYGQDESTYDADEHTWEFQGIRNLTEPHNLNQNEKDTAGTCVEGVHWAQWTHRRCLDYENTTESVKDATNSSYD